MTLLHLLPEDRVASLRPPGRNHWNRRPGSRGMRGRLRVESLAGCRGIRNPTAAATLQTLDGFIDTRYLIKDLNTFAKEARPLLDKLGPIRGDEAVPIGQSVFTVESTISGRLHIILICTTGRDKGWQITGYTMPLVQDNEDEIEDWTRLFDPIPLNLDNGPSTPPFPRGVLEFVCPKWVRDVVRLHRRGLLQLEPIEYGSGLEVGATYNVTVAPS